MCFVLVSSRQFLLVMRDFWFLTCSGSLGASFWLQDSSLGAGCLGFRSWKFKEPKDLATAVRVLDCVNKHECKTCAQTCAGTSPRIPNILALGDLKDCLSLQLRWVRRCLLLDGMFDGQLSFLNGEIPLLNSFPWAVC